MNPSTRVFPAILPFRMFWLLVSVLSVAVAAPVQAQSYPASGAEPYPAGSGMLQSSDQGDAVSSLQQRLSELGYYSGPVNGYFDATTQEAVSRFQQANGLTADGIVGSATSSVLYGASSGAGASSSAAVPSGAVLQVNDEGNQVTELQQLLSQRGYYNGSVTGVYDEQTKAAVIAFQRAQGLSADGIVGSATEAALQQAAPQNATAMQQTTTTESTYTPVANDGLLQLGDVGSEVSDLQTRLQNMGYYDGPISGSFGSQTQAALIAFQQAQGLTADGIAGPRVETALASVTSSTSPSQVTASQTATATTAATTPTFTQQTVTQPAVTQPAVTQPSIGQPATSSIGSTATGTTIIAPQTTSAIQPAATVQVPSLAPSIAPTTTPSLGQQPMAQSMPPSSPMPPGRPTQPRSQSDRFGVVELQRRLQLHGFDPGEITGVYDSSTQNAITQAQQAYGLSQSDLFGN